MKNYILLALISVTSFSIYAQSKIISKVAVDNNITRYTINYENGIPTLAKNKFGNLKFYFEKYVKIENDKKVNTYDLILSLNSNISNSLNKDIYVTVVFEDYSIINARPSLESEGTFNGNITIPITNTTRLSTIPIKTIIFKHKVDVNSETITDSDDFMFKLDKNNPGNKILMQDVKLLKNAL